jgi:hypothetical protein
MLASTPVTNPVVSRHDERREYTEGKLTLSFLFAGE